jgi:hypothetical protein
VSPVVLITLKTTWGPDLEDADVEGPAAEVVHRHCPVEALAEPVGQRGRGRFVDDSDHVEAGDEAGVLGGLPLVVVESRPAR